MKVWKSPAPPFMLLKPKLTILGTLPAWEVKRGQQMTAPELVSQWDRFHFRISLFFGTFLSLFIVLLLQIVLFKVLKKSSIKGALRKVLKRVLKEALKKVLHRYPSPDWGCGALWGRGGVRRLRHRGITSFATQWVDGERQCWTHRRTRCLVRRLSLWLPPTNPKERKNKREIPA